MSRVFCIGHAVQDFVFHLDTLPSRAEKYPARNFESVGGGPAATAAVAIARLDGEAALAARIGSDSVGRAVVDELQGFGVDCTFVKPHDGRTTSLSCVLVDAAGERMIVNYADPDLATDTDWLPSIDSLRPPVESSRSTASTKRRPGRSPPRFKWKPVWRSSTNDGLRQD